MYDAMAYPPIFSFNLPYLHQSVVDEECGVLDSHICIMEQTIRIYRRKVDFISDPESPLVQIPIKAIADVV